MAKEKQTRPKTKKLVIVESAAKVKTIAKILGAGYDVASCHGHVSDLPASSLGVDVANGFTPTYVSTADQEKTLAALARKAKKAEALYLATDPDREGEAIASHLAQKLNGKKTYRISFNEITKEAVLAAVAEPRDIDERLVAAQQARRILDRLVGYQVSPILWKNVARGLSAGRVQSVAVRLICEREEEIANFVPVEYWTIEATFTTENNEKFAATLAAINGETLMAPGRLERYDRRLAAKTEASTERKKIIKEKYAVASFERKDKKRSPGPPFTTSTLQQAASRRFGFTGTKTMVVAQQLYEGVDLGDGDRVGLITYMRTDAVRVAASAVDAARRAITEQYGPAFVPPEPRFYRARKGAQEAHEAVRPTDVRRRPEEIKEYLSAEQAKLYDLIYRQFLASQMADAIFDAAAATVEGGGYLFRATSQAVKFPGFLAVLPPEDAQDTRLPAMAPGDGVAIGDAKPEQHFTQPPPRYNDASLVKALEENGIGRPSTYAPTIQTIIARQYVERQRRAFRPTEQGKLVNALLVASFPDIFNVKFTAHVEAELDDLEEGRADVAAVLQEFYEPFAADLAKAGDIMNGVRDNAVEATDVTCPKCGALMEIRWGRFGKYLRCTNHPTCDATMNFERDAEGKIVAAVPPSTGEICEKCGGAMVVKRGRFGEFLACENYPECKNTKTIKKKIDAVCPKCGGAVVQRRARRGNIFYGCEKYPACDFTANAVPANEPCPKCGAAYLLRGNDGVFCAQKGCDYKADR